MNLLEDKQFLLDTANTKMPYGKYKGVYLVELPERYVIWYRNKGFPTGKLGKMLELIYEIKLNGLEFLMRELRKP